MFENKNIYYMNDVKYGEALEKARTMKKCSNNSEVINCIDTIFPELKESEDERIRESIIHLIKMSNEFGGFALQKWEADEMIAWIEKLK